MYKIVKFLVIVIIICGLSFCFYSNLEEKKDNDSEIILCTENAIQFTEFIEELQATETSEIVMENSTEPPTEEPTEPILFDKNIVFNYEYINNDIVMPFGLFTPLNVSEDEAKPLIIWLHGMGEFGVNEATFNNSSLPKILKETTFDGFNAYVICPHIIGKWYAPHWFRPWAVDNVKNLLDWFIKEYNIDTSRVVISGHSSGGVGAMWITHELPTYFSKMAILSGEGIGEKIYKINIPAKGYVENSGRHYNYMKYTFEPVFGEENLTVYNASHSDIPEIVFTEDLDGNNRIDVIEWLLQDDNVD